MKNFICALFLSCVAAAPAIAGDAGEMLRDRLTFCSQFVIDHPDRARFAAGSVCEGTIAMFSMPTTVTADAARSIYRHKSITT
jgi:hypothetical protein